MGSQPHTPPPQLTAEPVPVAFLGRTSTLYMQDPAASQRRQLRECEAKLPPGWYFAAHFWDVESGGLDIEQRGHGTAWQQVDAGIPRDGGLADLLAEAASPTPRFAAVMCEDIERSGRDTFNALKLEKELAAAQMPLFAADEPIDVAGVNATTVLIRRVKQGVAEWFRLQIKEKAWKGLREHSLEGWNIGTPPYGYAAQKVTHPVPFKAQQGRTKTRLILDPPRAAVVAQMFTWRTEERLGVPTITGRLNANPDAYPPPDPATGWTDSGVRSILRNPKYTGHMVFGRTRKTNGITRAVPPAEWLWSPEPSHPAIITRATFDAAQDTAASKAGSRDGDEPSGHAFTRRSYVLRSRLRCRDCRRRMHGITRPSSRYYTSGPDASYTYYVCPHDAAKPRHAALAPDHPRSVSVREDALLAVVHQMFRERIFGPERAALLAELIPANAAAEAAQRGKQETALRRRLRQIDASENAQAREIEALAHVKDPHSRAVTAMRTRHLARFTELEDERAQADAQLAALAKTTRDTGDPSLLDRLPMLGDLITEAPIRLQRRLYEAFDLQLLYNKHMHQVTIWATITPTTPRTLAAIINDSDDGHPTASNTPAGPDTSTSHPEFSDPLPAPMWRGSSVIMEILWITGRPHRRGWAGARRGSRRPARRR